MNMEIIKALFRKVFNNAEGYRVISLLQKMIDSHPRTELDCAQAVGMHAIVDTIVHYAGIFMENNHGRDDGE